MAVIKPFRGLRYNQDIIKDISSVVTPPYDVISPQDQERYYQIHSNNIIRLDLGKDIPGDDEKTNKYTRAAEFLNKWEKTGILKQEDSPAIYIYDQEFLSGNRWQVRRGFVALVKLEPFDKGYIYPHEQTLPGPKADRLKLTQSCQANLSSIFALFPDENNEVDSYLSTMTVTKPEIDFTDDTWNELISLYNNPYFEKEETCMRNRVGSSIYVDSEVLEIATHPVRVEPGFVQKAADSLYLARKELVDFVNPQHWRPIEYYRLIGYSMHWNISNVVRQANPYDILKDAAT